MPTPQVARNIESAPPGATKSKSKSLKKKSKSVAKKAADTVSTKADELADDAISKTRSKADAYAQRGVNKTEDFISALGRAVEAGSASLEQDGMGRTAAYARAAANGLGKAASEVEEFNPTKATGRIEQIVRSNPLLTVGALAVAGFALAGIMKSKDRA